LCIKVPSGLEKESTNGSVEQYLRSPIFSVG
jgi:hypothetical protein